MTSGVAGTDLLTFVSERIGARNEDSRAFFSRDSERLARAAAEMAERFLRGGRLLSLGRAASATDAQHVAFEFARPLGTSTRSLPAVDLSPAFERWLPAIVRSADIVMGFCEPTG